MRSFQERLKSTRQDRNLNQQEVAEALHITMAALTNYENGYRERDLTLLVSIANYFDVPLDYLLCTTDLRASFSKRYK